ncbi:MAG: bifunctional phosphoribosyl-AMP cyclohydrolase/phosphoribosyl-ATP diphosphatase HisIE [Eubacteriales bacterium]
MDTLRFPCIYLKSGLAVDGYFDGVIEDEADEGEGKDPVEKAVRLGQETDTQGLMVFDFSDDDADHDRSVEAIGEICRSTQQNVIAAGDIRSIEGVKEYLGAGCAKVILNLVKDSNKEIFEEVSSRFGKTRIGAYIPDYNAYLMMKDDIEKYAGILLVDRDDDDDVKIVEETSLPVLLHDDQKGECLEANFRTRDFESEIQWKDFKLNSDGLIPCVVQDYKTDKVLMVAYMNEESFQKTLETGRMTYWSRSRQELWMKGLTSGHFQYLKELRLDCDNDTLLAKVAQVGAACHTGNFSCFYRTIMKKEDEAVRPTRVLLKTFDEIKDNQKDPVPGTELTELLSGGPDKILSKIGDDETGLILASKNNRKSCIVEGIADMMMDCMVLMAEKNLTWDDIAEEISDRR